MKHFLFCAALTLLGSTTFAQTVEFQWPDFNMQPSYARSLGKNDPGVQAYAARLHAKAFKVTDGKPGPTMYAVVTDNGYTFDVEVVYIGARADHVRIFNAARL